MIFVSFYSFVEGLPYLLSAERDSKVTTKVPIGGGVKNIQFITRILQEPLFFEQ